jgi:23S rRNA (uracil1939-C5)-methyltransferase
MTTAPTRLFIERLGQRGAGVSRSMGALVFVPYALAGETVLAEIDGERGRLVEIETASKDRIPPFCQYFSSCGGCAVQSLAREAYAQWKRDLVSEALQRAGLEADIAPVVDAHGEGRRRATFHVRADAAAGRHRVGFMQARAHEIVEIDACPLLAPSLGKALAAVRALVDVLWTRSTTLDALVTATETGLSVDLRGHGPLAPRKRQELVRIALAHDLACLSNHGEMVLVQRAPVLTIGDARVVLPPGAFLQATRAGETAIAAEVCAALAEARRIADLFAGIGTFALRLAEHATVHAVDCDPAALDALAKAVRARPAKPLSVATRDLFRRPLPREDLAGYDAVVLDPPRAGAESQAHELAASTVPVVVSVSCNVQSFARDAAILCAGGYEIGTVVPIDQFRHTPHIEIVTTFRRKRRKGAAGRKLLG